MSFWLAATLITGVSCVTAIVAKLIDVWHAAVQARGVKPLEERIEALEQKLELTETVREEQTREIEALKADSEFYRRLGPPGSTSSD